MALETFIGVEAWEDHTVDSSIWWISGIPFIPASLITILELDEDGLLTALAISILTDQRLPFDGNEPLTQDDRRGWFGDNLLTDGDLIGSRLWTLARHKMDSNIISLSEDMIKEALAWLIEDGVLKDLKVTVTRVETTALLFKVEVMRPGDYELTPYYFVWNNVTPE